MVSEAACRRAARCRVRSLPYFTSVNFWTVPSSNSISNLPKNGLRILPFRPWTVTGSLILIGGGLPSSGAVVSAVRLGHDSRVSVFHRRDFCFQLHDLLLVGPRRFAVRQGTRPDISSRQGRCPSDRRQRASAVRVRVLRTRVGCPVDPVPPCLDRPRDAASSRPRCHRAWSTRERKLSMLRPPFHRQAGVPFRARTRHEVASTVDPSGIEDDCLGRGDSLGAPKVNSFSRSPIEHNRTAGRRGRSGPPAPAEGPAAS